MREVKATEGGFLHTMRGKERESLGSQHVHKDGDGSKCRCERNRAVALVYVHMYVHSLSKQKENGKRIPTTTP